MRYLPDSLSSGLPGRRVDAWRAGMMIAADMAASLPGETELDRGRRVRSSRLFRECVECRLASWRLKWYYRAFALRSSTTNLEQVFMYRLLLAGLAVGAGLLTLQACRARDAKSQNENDEKAAKSEIKAEKA